MGLCLLRPEGLGSAGTVPPACAECVVSPCRAAGALRRCTRAWLPVAPGAAVDCMAGLRVSRVVRCLCAERPPLRRPTSPHITFSVTSPGGGAQGGRRACGRGGGPCKRLCRATHGPENRKRPDRSAEHRQTDIVAALLAAPGAQARTGAGRPRRPPTGGDWTSRLPCSGCPAGREPERTPPRTKAAGSPTVYVICVLSPVQSLPVVLLSAGPCIR